MAQSPETQIGHLIRARRKRAELSISGLAELSGLDPSYVNHLELGKVNPTLSTLTKIARGLDIELRDLLSKVKAGEASMDHRVLQAVRALLAKHPPAQKRAILSVLQALRNPKRLEAVRQLVGR